MPPRTLTTTLIEWNRIRSQNKITLVTIVSNRLPVTPVDVPNLNLRVTPKCLFQGCGIASGSFPNLKSISETLPPRFRTISGVEPALDVSPLWVPVDVVFPSVGTGMHLEELNWSDWRPVVVPSWLELPRPLMLKRRGWHQLSVSNCRLLHWPGWNSWPGCLGTT